MTRKKWQKLRRQRPDLMNVVPAWERMTRQERAIMRPVSKSRTIAVMTGYKLEHLDEGNVGAVIYFEPYVLEPFWDKDL